MRLFSYTPLLTLSIFGVAIVGVLSAPRAFADDLDDVRTLIDGKTFVCKPADHGSQRVAFKITQTSLGAWTLHALIEYERGEKTAVKEIIRNIEISKRELQDTAPEGQEYQVKNGTHDPMFIDTEVLSIRLDSHNQVTSLRMESELGFSVTPTLDCRID